MSRREFARCAGRCALLSAGVGLLPFPLFSEAESTAGPKKGLEGRKQSPYFTPDPEGGIRCDLCPHACRIENGGRGRCGVRENVDGTLWTDVYGNPCAVNIDPVEKKPFHHVLPGSRTLSLATVSFTDCFLSSLSSRCHAQGAMSSRYKRS